MICFFTWPMFIWIYSTWHCLHSPHHQAFRHSPVLRPSPGLRLTHIMAAVADDRARFLVKSSGRLRSQNISKHLKEAWFFTSLHMSKESLVVKCFGYSTTLFEKAYQEAVVCGLVRCLTWNKPRAICSRSLQLIRFSFFGAPYVWLPAPPEKTW